jgi:hypothetical protein
MDAVKGANDRALGHRHRSPNANGTGQRRRGRRGVTRRRTLALFGGSAEWPRFAELIVALLEAGTKENACYPTTPNSGPLVSQRNEGYELR